MAFIVIVITFALLVGDSLLGIIPTMGVFGLAALRLKPTANNLATSLIQLRFQRDSISRLVNDIKSLKKLKLDEKIPASVGRSNITFQKLEISKVNFSYNVSSQPALEKVSLKVLSG